MLFPQDTSASDDLQSYLVFARKYRPQNFQELIGQNHLVDILTNAFDKDRIHHAYILTGVRGVGKTTTARIIAKGLNCMANDKPTVNPCGECSNCVSITAGKNIDVFEMDAASRTGIDDIREIIDSIPYKPLNCRYKVYIIDEIHMLSKSAFNGLLKTLEEPPPHIKFIFATTEIHKVLPTVISRCQKIDLKRVDIPTLTAFFAKILNLENVIFDDTAIAKIARAADGSVRDGLSLLDQAVSAGAGEVTLSAVSDMLGVASGDEILDIIAECVQYHPTQALELFYKLYDSGFDCYLFAKELLRTTEWLVRLKFTPDIAKDASLNAEFTTKSMDIANNTDVHLLSRMWDIALQATQDIKIAPDPKAVCEMAIIRINYGLTLPDPAIMYQNVKIPQSHQSVSDNNGTGVLESEKKNSNAVTTPITPQETFNSIHQISALLSQNRLLECVRLLEVKAILHTVKQGYIELSNAPTYTITPQEISGLKTALDKLTGCVWEIILKATLENVQVQKKSIYEAKKEIKNNLLDTAQDDPLVKAVLTTFNTAKLIEVTTRNALPLDTDLLETNDTIHTIEDE